MELAMKTWVKPFPNVAPKSQRRNVLIDEKISLNHFKPKNFYFIIYSEARLYFLWLLL